MSTLSTFGIRELVPFEKANLHFLNTSLHYGISVFEGVRSNSSRLTIFRLKEHMERLQDSLKLLGVNKPP